jgi:hypothetical protein
MLANLKVITPSSEHSKELCDLLIESITINCASDYNNSYLGYMNPNQFEREWGKMKKVA